MTQKYLSPYTGKMVSAHQFLADLVLFHRGEDEIWKDQKDAKAQFVAAAKISKQFTDEFDLVIKVVVKKRAKSLLPFIWKKCCIMEREIDKLNDCKNKKRPVFDTSDLEDISKFF